MMGGLLAILLFAGSAWAVDPTVFVDENDDIGGGTGGAGISLREAIALTPSGGTVNVPAGTYTLTINASGAIAGDIDIANSVNIVGADQDTTIVDASGISNRIFDIDSDGIVVNISNLTVRNGDASEGGGIRHDDGNLRMRKVTVSSCSCDNSGGGLFISSDTGSTNVIECSFISNSAGDAGGGLFNEDGTSVSVDKCFFFDNQASGNGGGIFNANGGDIMNLSNSTVSGNRAVFNGGGIYNSEEMSIFNTTVTNNTARVFSSTGGNGGGIYCAGTGTELTNITNSIVAGNEDTSTDVSFDYPDVFSSFTGCFVSGGGNLIGINNLTTADFPTGNTNANGDIVGTLAAPEDPGIGPLSDNGGCTPTHGLLAGSQAIDAGTGTCALPLDQRRVTRPQNGICDIGAVEFIDCDANTIDDVRDIVSNGVADIDSNAVPDSCEGACCVGTAAEIVLAIDVSGSVTSSGLAVEVDGIKECLNDPTLVPQNGSIAVGIVSYADAATNALQLTPLTPANLTNLIEPALDALVSGGATATGAGLQLARQMLNGPGSTTDNDYIFLVGDGQSNVPPGTAAAQTVGSECSSIGFENKIICSAAIGSNITAQAQLEDCADATGGESGMAATPADFQPVCEACFESLTALCQIASESRCDAIAGQYQGDATTCGLNLCLTSADCNNNVLPDECDLAAGTSDDCNFNQVPDECEPDCNNNGTPDDCDVISGTSPDCNFNGSPDACDIASGTSEDCQSNGIPDECDIAAGDSNDNDADGIPNECDGGGDGWPSVDVGLVLTANQPTYWSVYNGAPGPGGPLVPFTVLSPNVGGVIGRPDPEGSTERVLRGFLVLWAVDASGNEIRWNHLSGKAVTVNYDLGAAWEYNAYAFQTVDPNVAHGANLPSPGFLFLNGQEYASSFDLLLLDFYATGADVFNTGAGATLVDTDLTLLPMWIDLRQETFGPATTKANFTVWNQNEFKLTGLDHCVTCWDQALFSNYEIPNHLLRINLQTNKGKARIDGLESQVCDIDAVGGDGPLGSNPDDRISEVASLLGVAAKQLTFAGGATDRAGMNLVGMGTQSGLITADILGTPPPEREEAADQLIDAFDVHAPGGVQANGRPRLSRVVARGEAPGTRGFEIDPCEYDGKGCDGEIDPPIPPAAPVSGRVSFNEKGSLLVFPAIELRWNAAGTRLIQDTFIELTNDYPGDVNVQLYYVDGDPPA
jgi:uncharacterized protein YegL